MQCQHYRRAGPLSACSPQREPPPVVKDVRDGFSGRAGPVRGWHHRGGVHSIGPIHSTAEPNSATIAAQR